MVFLLPQGYIVKPFATIPKCLPQPCWHWLTGGTFESDMDGTFKVSQSRPTVYNTTEDRFFDFWTDGHTVAAILYVQESYDTYDWDAEVNVKGVNKHYLNVAPDGSWTLR